MYDHSICSNIDFIKMRTNCYRVTYCFKFEAQSLLGCIAVFLIGCRPTFKRCVLPPTSGRWVSLARKYRWLYRNPLNSDDGGSTHLWNVGRHPIKNTAVHPRRLWASYTPPRELEISYFKFASGTRNNFYLENLYFIVKILKLATCVAVVRNAANEIRITIFLNPSEWRKQMSLE
jgi:hypothetical protein